MCPGFRQGGCGPIELPTPLSANLHWDWDGRWETLQALEGGSWQGGGPGLGGGRGGCCWTSARVPHQQLPCRPSRLYRETEPTSSKGRSPMSSWIDGFSLKIKTRTMGPCSSSGLSLRNACGLATGQVWAPRGHGYMLDTVADLTGTRLSQQTDTQTGGQAGHSFPSSPPTRTKGTGNNFSGLYLLIWRMGLMRVASPSRVPGLVSGVPCPHVLLPRG